MVIARNYPFSLVVKFVVVLDYHIVQTEHGKQGVIVVIFPVFVYAFFVRFCVLYRVLLSSGCGQVQLCILKNLPFIFIIP